MRRIVHVITSLEAAGAQRVLLELLAGTDRSRFAHRVVSLGDLGVWGPRILELGWPVAALGLAPGRPSPAAWDRLRRALARDRADVVQTWLYHADLLGGLAARAAGVPRVVWGVHNTDLVPGASRWHTRAVAAVDARLAPHVADRIVCCAQSAARHHVARGYPAERIEVIPNGVRVPDPAPDRAAARHRLRAQLDVPDDTVLVAHVARRDPQKDHATLLDAAARVRAQAPRVRLLLVGAGVEPTDPKLRAELERRDLGDTVQGLGPRDDVPELLAGVDLLVSSSAFGEALPMVLLEALAVGTPVVATDVGDSRAVAGDAGWVVPPRDPGALAEALLRAVDEPPDRRRERGERGRAHVRARYGLARMVAAYERCWTEGWQTPAPSPAAP